MTETPRTETVESRAPTDIADRLDQDAATRAAISRQIWEGGPVVRETDLRPA
ncbi:MAG: hypothetical protein U0Q21_02930 [Dermatophilaceae bacterium]